MEDPYKTFFDAMPGYVTVQDRTLRILHANERFLKDFGDFAGRCCYQVYKQRAEKCESCPVEQAFHDGECHRSEERVIARDGRELVVLVEAVPVRGPSGEIVSAIETSTDVTLIRRLAEQLRQNQEKYRLLFEEVPCYISIQDADLRILEANRAFQEDFGNGLGCKCYEVYKHRTEACFPCPVQETFQDGQPHTREEVVTSRKGETINVLVVTAPILDSEGRIVRVMEMSANITEVRRLESQLTSIGLMVGSVSHSLKGLLNGLAGGTYLVNTGFAKDDRRRVDQGWEIVQRNIDRIRSTVSDILYYAKERTPNWESLSAADVSREVAGLMETRAKELGIRLTRTLETPNGRFEADPQAVRSLLSNLLENSLDACRLDRSKTDHAVTFRVRETPEHVQFEIEDNGIGMDRETREKAFTLFFSSKGTEGTGLGLFVASRIARAHNGSIDVSSEPGRGTRFTVRLPRHRPAGAPSPASPQQKGTAT